MWARENECFFPKDHVQSKKHFWKQHFRRMIQYFRKHIIGRNGRGIHSILLNLNLKFSQDVLQSLTIDILSRCVDFITKFQWHFDVIVPKLHRISETNYVFGKLSDLSGISTDSQKRSEFDLQEIIDFEGLSSIEGFTSVPRGMWFYNLRSAGLTAHARTLAVTHSVFPDSGVVVTWLNPGCESI